MKRYRATLIQNGRALGSQEFEAPDGPTAWREANDGLDPLKGQWADVREIIEPAPALPAEATSQKEPNQHEHD